MEDANEEMSETASEKLLYAKKKRHGIQGMNNYA